MQMLVFSELLQIFHIKQCYWINIFISKLFHLLLVLSIKITSQYHILWIWFLFSKVYAINNLFPELEDLWLIKDFGFKLFGELSEWISQIGLWIKIDHMVFWYSEKPCSNIFEYVTAVHVLFESLFILCYKYN